MSQDKFELQVHRRAVDGFFSIFEDMCEGAISVDRDARIVWINEKYRALLGIPEGSEVLGNKVESVIPESLLRHVVETGNPIPVDIMVFEDHHFVVSRLPLLGDSGELIGAVGFVLYDNLDYLKPLISKFDRLQKKLNDVQGELALARRTRYARVSRYATSAFMRMKLGRMFTRELAPHIFETREEAQAFVGGERLPRLTD